MFDDFVQSSSSHSTPQNHRRISNNLANGQYVNGSRFDTTFDSINDGFEGDDYGTRGIEGDDSGHDGFVSSMLDPIAALETGFISSDAGPSSHSDPIFQLGRVQYAFSAPLALMTVSSNILTMCLYAYPNPSQAANPFPTAPPKLVRINLDDPERTQEADVPIPPTPRSARNAPPPDPSTVGPYKMFADPSGLHLLLAMRNGDNYYWASGWRKARLLPKLKGHIIESVAWNRASLAGNASSNASAARKRAANGTPALSSTREILLGTRSGDIYEAVITAPVGTDPDDGDIFDKIARRTAGNGAERGDVDRVVRLMTSLPERQPVTGLAAEVFPRPSPTSTSNPPTPASSELRRAVVIATTSTRVYEYVGVLAKASKDESDSSSLYDKLFLPYRGDSSPNLKSELPGDLPYSELHAYTSASSKHISALAWLTGPGVYHGLLSYPPDATAGDSVIESANLLPYPAVAIEDEGSGSPNKRRSRMSTASNGFGSAPITKIPLSIALTEFHFVLLYQDRVMAISSLDDQVIFEEALPLKANERVIGTAVDAAKRTYWIYTDASIFELVLRDEDRHVWRVHLDRGSFDMALKYAKPGIQRGTVLSFQGDRYFAEGKYIQAAQCYAQTFMRAFEEIVLRFTDVEQRDALRYYLVMRLERLDKTVDVAQRIMLATWLVEIYLSKINQLEDVAAAEAASQDVDNYRLEITLITEELHQFLATYRSLLDPQTTFDLIKKHGRSDVYLHFASVVGDHDRIVRHHVQTQQWTKAIDAINKQDSLELYYSFAPVLMRHAPAQTVDCWSRQRSLDARKLIPALLQHKPDLDLGETDQAVKYLAGIIAGKNGSKDTAIHNLLLTLLARRSSRYPKRDELKEELLRFIDEAKPNPMTGHPYFDLDYALRTCLSQRQMEACVRIYAKMGLYESAVELAIREGEIELACSCADMAESMDRDLRKKLWLRVAKEVVRTSADMKSAMAFLRRTDLISIEDVLPFFPDFAVIDDCKDDICEALEGYAAHIEELKDEMDEASRSAAAIQQDIARLSERFVTIDPDQRCHHCMQTLVQRQFYIFPCRHGFHADCLIGEGTKTMSTRSLRKLLELQQQISALTSGLVPALPNSALANMGFLKDGSKAMVSAAQGARQAGLVGLQASARGLGNVTAAVGLDKLRELVVPDAVISAISAGVSVSVAGGRRVLAPLDPFSNPTSDLVAGSRTAAQRRAAALIATDADANSASAEYGEDKNTIGSARSIEDQERIQQLRDQLDALIAGSCPMCEGTANAIGRPFISDKEAAEEWAL
ncbi:Clathrin, heavy chain/VPS, 7-fold repeat [Kalmanozyma brasiliensis GHG001]|uniref:Clathrin, heavy chain/VPS, 7-fold repeat n=1 Tax=Kalmanozyma brasiliensis (strain GHG001) TaxID=1365824 RepID=UPI002867E65F|nr:Clathrin, heavy chain/VPS, 7-fold repeat [Kalmanozyma brasiliensis GHG001]KAF6767215.1 Clathrin, heavy chain/VPS, 7-fold repeat [Kalmanozyma brasiliensis GHG001]